MRLLVLTLLSLTLSCALTPTSKSVKSKAEQVIEPYCDTDSLHRALVQQDSIYRLTEEKSRDSLYKHLKHLRNKFPN